MLRILVLIVEALLIAAGPPPARAEPAGGQADVILYIDADSERVRASIAKFELALQRRGVTARHRVTVQHVPVDVFKREQATQRIAAALREHPAMVIATSSESAAIVGHLTPDIPIIFGSQQDPVRVGLVRSLADPGANLTGFTFFAPIDLKRLELLREIAPAAGRLGIVIDHWWMQETDGVAIVHAARDKLGFKGRVFLMETPEDLHQLQSAAARDMDAWYVPNTTLPYEHPEALLHALAALRKPTMFPSATFAEAGGLVAYQPKTSLAEALDLFAKIAGLILDGVAPGTIPIERPKSFELLVNVAEARRLGISLPDAFLKRADRVIDEPQAQAHR